MSNLGELINQYVRLKDQIDECNKRKAELENEKDNLEIQITDLMEQGGLDKAQSPLGSVSRKVELYPRIADKSAFIDWCYKTGNTDILQSQCNRAAFRRYYDDSNEYPDGIEAYEKSSLLLRRSK